MNMVVNKRKKVGRYRAHTTHGGGSRKKRRGAGSRGGRGNAGTGKRAGHKVAGRRIKLGGHGFTPHSSQKTSSAKALNVSYFTPRKMEELLAGKKATKEGDSFLLNLKDLGYDKLLGSGATKLKLKISVSGYSKRAEEKIKAAGGSVISLQESARSSSTSGSRSESKPESKSEKASSETEEDPEEK